MIQDIAPHVFNNQYMALPPEKNSYLFYFEGRNVLVIENEEGISFPRFNEIIENETEFYKEAIYLFSIDQERFYLSHTLPSLDKKYCMKDISIFRTAQPQYLTFAGVTAFSLATWYQSRQYCGKCATRLQHHTKERMMECPACNQMEYPKISPAVIVGVTNGNKILLTKYANRPYTNYALLAGFAEAGESIEETVRREVMEEAGIRIKNIRFYKSQPWGFTDCLLLGYFADVDGNDTITMDKEELAVAEWVERKDVPPAELTISLTSEMMELFRTGGI